MFRLHSLLEVLVYLTKQQLIFGVKIKVLLQNECKSTGRCMTQFSGCVFGNVV